MRHQTHLVQRRLAVEQDHVAVHHVPLHNVTYFELRGHFPAVPELEEPLVAVRKHHEVGSRVLRHPVHHALAQHLDVVARHFVRVRHVHGDVHGHAHLVDPEVRVRGDHRASTEVHSLAAKIPPKPPLLALQPLNKPPQRFPRSLELRQACQLAVDVHGALALQKVPLLHEVHNCQPTLQPRVQHVVHLDDLHQLHGDVVLIGPCRRLHLH
mmetsp:Transcript_7775/g.13375  ORF Transcript_7775/g.13375 Transcript_7775/m.13375 type:complete len:211 (+) Transcript_7775:2772-3404(+)